MLRLESFWKVESCKTCSIGRPTAVLVQMPKALGPSLWALHLEGTSSLRYLLYNACVPVTVMRKYQGLPEWSNNNTSLARYFSSVGKKTFYKGSQYHLLLKNGETWSKKRFHKLATVLQQDRDRVKIHLRFPVCLMFWPLQSMQPSLSKMHLEASGCSTACG